MATSSLRPRFWLRGNHLESNWNSAAQYSLLLSELQPGQTMVRLIAECYAFGYWGLIGTGDVPPAPARWGIEEPGIAVGVTAQPLEGTVPVPNPKFPASGGDMWLWQGLLGPYRFDASADSGRIAGENTTLWVSQVSASTPRLQMQSHAAREYGVDGVEALYFTACGSATGWSTTSELGTSTFQYLLVNWAALILGPAETP